MDTEKKTPFRVALIGLGAVSNNHVRSLLDNPDVTICALCDTKQERLDAKQSEYGLSAALYTDYKEMITREHPDTVHIMTPHYLHAEMAVYALEHGADVFLEKPMGISLADIARIREAEERSGRSVCVCFQNRFNRSTIAAQHLAAADGGVLAAYATVIWNRDEQYYTGSDWRGFYATEGGGVMINQAIHTIDLMCYFLGKPRALSATTANHHLKGIIEVEDTCEGRIEFENGSSGCFYATTAFEGTNETTLLLHTKNHRIEIRTPNVFVDGKIYEIPEDDMPYYGKECYGKGHRTLITLFYEALKNGTEIPVNTESASVALKVLLASYRSHGNTVDIQ